MRHETNVEISHLLPIKRSNFWATRGRLKLVCEKEMEEELSTLKLYPILSAHTTLMSSSSPFKIAREITKKLLCSFFFCFCSMLLTPTYTSTENQFQLNIFLFYLFILILFPFVVSFWGWKQLIEKFFMWNTSGFALCEVSAFDMENLWIYILCRVILIAQFMFFIETLFSLSLLWTEELWYYWLTHK